MILLPKNKYNSVVEPLNQVSINNLYARSVVNKHVNGSIFVDNEEHPKTFYIVHPYSMTLLFGEPNNEDFNVDFKIHALNTHKKREKHEWMQAYPSGTWNLVLEDLFKEKLLRSQDNKENKKDIIELNTRVNFKFDLVDYMKAKQDTKINEKYQIVRTDRTIFEKMNGSVVPKYFWDSAEDFCARGVGFSLLCDNEVVATAFSSFVHEKQLEIGIETVEKYRGKGFAKLVTFAIIDYCIENKLEPIWSCRLENTGSYKLAQQVGFKPTITIPYYRLAI